MSRGLLTYYDVLQVAADSDARAIRSAYLALIRKYHPDNCDNPEYGHYHSARINEAYRILGDPAKRSHYDAALARFHYNKVIRLGIVAWEGGQRAGVRLVRAPGDLLSQSRSAWQRRASQVRVAPARPTATRAPAGPALGPRLQLGFARLAAAGRARLAEAGSAGRTLRAGSANALGGLAKSISTAVPAPSSGAFAALMIAPLLVASFVLAVSYPTGFVNWPVQPPGLASETEAFAAPAAAARIAPAAPTEARVSEPIATHAARATSSIAAPVPAIGMGGPAELELPAAASASAPQAQPQPEPPVPVVRAPVLADSTQSNVPNEMTARRSPAPAAEPPALARRPSVSPQRACFDRIVDGPEVYRACVRAHSESN